MKREAAFCGLRSFLVYTLDNWAAQARQGRQDGLFIYFKQGSCPQQGTETADAVLENKRGNSVWRAPHNVSYRLVAGAGS